MAAAELAEEAREEEQRQQQADTQVAAAPDQIQAELARIEAGRAILEERERARAEAAAAQRVEAELQAARTEHSRRQAATEQLRLERAELLQELAQLRGPAPGARDHAGTPAAERRPLSPPRPGGSALAAEQLLPHAARRAPPAEGSPAPAAPGGGGKRRGAAPAGALCGADALGRAARRALLLRYYRRLRSLREAAFGRRAAAAAAAQPHCSDSAPQTPHRQGAGGRPPHAPGDPELQRQPSAPPPPPPSPPPAGATRPPLPGAAPAPLQRCADSPPPTGAPGLARPAPAAPSAAGPPGERGEAEVAAPCVAPPPASGELRSGELRSGELLRSIKPPREYWRGARVRRACRIPSPATQLPQSGAGGRTGAAAAGSAAGSGTSAGGGGGGGAPPPYSGPLRILAAGKTCYGPCGVSGWEYSPSIVTPVFAAGLQPPPGTRIVKICCGGHFVLMLTEQGAVLHAGSNCHGQLGAGLEDGHAHPKLCPVDLGGHRAVDIACGWSHIAVALSTGAALTWGQVSRYWQSTTYGCSGLGRDGDWKIPGMAEGVAEVERVYAGETFTFFLSRGGEVAACGDNICGQLCLGHPTHERVDRPQRAAPLCGRRILQLQASALQCIMLEEDGSVWVWGAGVRHEGDFDTWSDDSWSDSREVVPIRLAVGPALCVAAGYDDRCAAVTVKGVLMQWRYLWYPWRPPPVPLPGGQPATAVVCNDASIWARSSKGEWAVRARGRDYGQPIEGRLVRELRPIKPIKAADLSHCLPLTGSQSHFALYLEGQEAEAVWRRSVGFPTSGVLSVSGRELGEEDYEALLSDVGVSAECLVELLRVPRLPPAAGCAPPPMARALVVYVCAPRFGRAEPVCVELQPDATVLDLVAAAAESLGV